MRDCEEHARFGFSASTSLFSLFGAAPIASRTSILTSRSNTSAPRIRRRCKLKPQKAPTCRRSADRGTEWQFGRTAYPAGFVGNQPRT